LNMVSVRTPLGLDRYNTGGRVRPETALCLLLYGASSIVTALGFMLGALAPGWASAFGLISGLFLVGLAVDLANADLIMNKGEV
jgi:hypothetical protein